MWVAFAFVAGFALCGILANRRPDLFAKVVKVANAADVQINDQINKL